MELGVAGVRLDAAKHIPRDDLAKIFAKVTLGGDAGPYGAREREKTRR